MRTKRVICACVLALLAGCTASTPQTSAPSAQATSPTPTSSESIAANGYSYGYGTYYVATRRHVPPNWGDANKWYVHAQAAGYKVGSTPKQGAIAWTDRGPYGQVAIVEQVSADGTRVVISEMNGGGEGAGWNQVTRRTAPATLFRYIYVYT